MGEREREAENDVLSPGKSQGHNFYDAGKEGRRKGRREKGKEGSHIQIINTMTKTKVLLELQLNSSSSTSCKEAISF